MSRTIAEPPRARTRSPSPNATDVVFRLGTACFAIWVVTSAATSPSADLRQGWWPGFLVAGGLIALAMLIGAFMTLRLYLRNR